METRALRAQCVAVRTASGRGHAGCACAAVLEWPSPAIARDANGPAHQSAPRKAVTGLTTAQALLSLLPRQVCRIALASSALPCFGGRLPFFESRPICASTGNCGRLSKILSCGGSGRKPRLSRQGKAVVGVPQRRIGDRNRCGKHSRGRMSWSRRRCGHRHCRRSCPRNLWHSHWFHVLMCWLTSRCLGSCQALVAFALGAAAAQRERCLDL